MNKKREFFTFLILLNSLLINECKGSTHLNGDQTHNSIIQDVMNVIAAEKVINHNLIVILMLMIVLMIILTLYGLRQNRLKTRLKIMNDSSKALFKNMEEGLAIQKPVFNKRGEVVDYQVVDANSWYIKILRHGDTTIIGKTIGQLYPAAKDDLIELMEEVRTGGEGLQSVKYYEKFDVYYSINVYNPYQDVIATLVRDITDQKRQLEKITYLSYHDQLTGLYNRHFFDEELIKLNNEEFLPLSLMMIDVNGLKLTNDAFGHKKGDELLIKVANIIEKACGDNFTARIGGDEFLVLIPNKTRKEAKLYLREIYDECGKSYIEDVVISVSIGLATKDKMDTKTGDVFNEAEERMYRRKLTESQSMRNQTIKSILKALNESNEREKVHSENVSKIAGQIGIEMKLNEEDISELKVAGLMHDIGKIIIDNSILNKKGSLSAPEYEEVKKHSETGYHILKSVDEYTELAEYALYHHERWDGTGYPKGIKGEKIPLFARIITVSDAYEAMMADRPYRSSISSKEALIELKRCSGTQFDPRVVDICLKIFQDGESSI